MAMFLFYFWKIKNIFLSVLSPPASTYSQLFSTLSLPLPYPHLSVST